MPSALTLPFALQVPLILNQTFDPGFHIDLHCKDLHLGYEIGRKFGVPLELFGLVQQTYLKAMYKYGGTAGSTHPARLIQDTLSELRHLSSGGSTLHPHITLLLPRSLASTGATHSRDSVLQHTVEIEGCPESPGGNHIFFSACISNLTYVP